MIEWLARREYDDVIRTKICSIWYMENTLYIQYIVYGEKPGLFSGEYHVRITKKEKYIFSREQIVRIQYIA